MIFNASGEKISESENETKFMPNIGIVGGTGDIGSALGVHLAKKNDRILIGSRSMERAQAVVLDILKDKSDRPYLKERLLPVTNDIVTSTCDTIIFTVPYSAAIETISSLRDKFANNDQILISAVASIERTRNEFIPIRKASSISKSIQEIVPSTVRVAAAFQTIPAKVLYKEEKLDADVFVCCNEQSTYLKTAKIVTSIEGLRPLYSGSLDISPEIEALTSILLNISVRENLKNPTFKIHSY